MAGVTRWWAGRGIATLPEPASSQENGLKTHRFPSVECTLCWAALLHVTEHNFWVMEVILQRFIKSAHVDSIHDSMMPLYA